MDFLKVAGSDIKGIFKNRFIRISIIAIIIVPLMYSLLYLYAFWDPYSQLSELPFAIVNQDIGTVVDNDDVNYGNDIIENLKTDDQMGWEFVDYDEAMDGLNKAEGGYYGVFIIPENFSENILSAKDSSPIQPKIIYSSNNKKNFITSQINSSVVLKLKENIVKNITKEYTKVTFESLYDLKDGLIAAADGSGQLTEGLNEAKDGSYELNDGLSLLKEKIPSLEEGVSDLSNGASALYTGISTTSVDASGSPLGLKNGISMLSTGLNSAKTGANDLNSGASQILQGVETVGAGLDSLNNAVSVGSDTTPSLTSALESIYSGVTNTSAGLGSAVTQLNVAVNTGSSSQPSLVNGMSSIEAGTNNIGATLTQVQALLNSGDATSIAQAKGIVAVLVNETTTNSTDPLKPTYLDGVQSINKAVSKQLAPGISMLNASVNGVDGINPLNGQPTLVAGVSKVYSAVTDSKNGLASGVAMLNAAVNTGYNGNPSLILAMTSLKDGTAALSSGISTATSASNSLLSGADKLADGSKQLQEGLVTLNSSVPELADGVTKLYDGSTSLNEGMEKLFDGSQELNDKLQEGATDISDSLVNTPSAMGEYVSEPVIITDDAINPVTKYGEGFAPYFIPLSLWVGVMLMFFIITDKVSGDLNVGSASLVTGKFLSYAFIGLLQAVLASVVVLFLGLRPNNIVMYFVFNIFMSMVFIGIIQCLVFLLGEAGRLLSIVLLIFQLTSCAGTFPLEVVPKFFKVLYPYMPFTYCVSALREIISGSNNAVIMKDILILAAVLLVSVSASVILKQHADKVHEKVRLKKDNLVY
ncbi:YhgE/Pip domain-containing protein [Clostridium grantii]|uniref:Putative membrane protein n=1 Tax=Clostridium grantii DSM 8605 TaxID=1121316 RepID=A0A1M5VZ67_9CLOT|nr:YhgE/Pip domain-containing protein [Clostridium grantii]SHH80480.1 putative membrane protein [Clostridium grantii DSM 8605]